jgi:hypothetical protein
MRGEKHMTTPNEIRSHRPNETADNYRRRLARAKLTRSDLREIETLYVKLDADRATLGLPPAERAPWEPIDILEWQDLNDQEKYLDIEMYAAACDRIAATKAFILFAA